MPSRPKRRVAVCWCLLLEQRAFRRTAQRRTAISKNSCTERGTSSYSAQAWESSPVAPDSAGMSPTTVARGARATPYAASAQLVGNIDRDVARPALGGVEGDDAD